MTKPIVTENQLTGAQLAEALKTKSAVRLSIRTGKTTRMGYGEILDRYFGNEADARKYAEKRHAQYFNLYGWTGQNWSSDAMPLAA